MCAAGVARHAQHVLSSTVPTWTELRAASKKILQNLGEIPDLDRPVLQTDLQIGNHHVDLTGRLGLAVDTGFGDKDFLVFPAPADWEFGATRGWHFLCAWILVFGAFAYGLYLLASGRLRRRVPGICGTS